MKAVVQDRYGPPQVLRIADVPRPVPKEDEVLVRVHSSTVTQTDTHVRAAHPFVWRFVSGLRRPRGGTLGVEFSGVVVEAGPSVDKFAVGDEVFGQPAWLGAHAEFVAVAQDGTIAHKPARATFEEAAATSDGAMQAFSALRASRIQAGQRLAIYGASGSLGTAAVQIAKAMDVTVVGITSANNLELVRSLGADEVVDYQTEDFTAAAVPFDAIIDAVGKGSFRKNRKALKASGTYVATDGLSNTLWAFRDKRMKSSRGRRSKSDLLRVRELIEEGKFRAIVDRSYPMDEVVAAHRYVETWQKVGNVVLAIAKQPDSA